MLSSTLEEFWWIFVWAKSWRFTMRTSISKLTCRVWWTHQPYLQLRKAHCRMKEGCSGVLIIQSDRTPVHNPIRSCPRNPAHASAMCVQDMFPDCWHQGGSADEQCESLAKFWAHLQPLRQGIPLKLPSIVPKQPPKVKNIHTNTRDQNRSKSKQYVGLFNLVL